MRRLQALANTREHKLLLLKFNFHDKSDKKNVPLVPNGNYLHTHFTIVKFDKPKMMKRIYFWIDYCLLNPLVFCLIYANLVCNFSQYWNIESFWTIVSTALLNKSSQNGKRKKNYQHGWAFARDKIRIFLHNHQFIN